MRFNSLKAIFNDCCEILRPPDRLTVSEAAEKYRVLHNPGSYVGPYKNDMAPYLVEIMDCLASREKTGVVFVKPVQCGGTELTLNWALHSIAVDPADMLLFHPTQSFARDFSRRRVDKMIRHSPEVKNRLMPRRDSDNTFDKMFRAGMMLTISWPSVTEVAGRPVGRQAISDYDRIPDDIGGEGSAFDLISKRGTTFGNFAMTLAESTPGRDSEDPKWKHNPNKPHEGPPCGGIVGLYNRGDRRLWYWPCPSCNEFFEPSYKLLGWQDKGSPQECGETAYMACPHCGDCISPNHRRAMNIKGKWLGEGQKFDKDGNVVGELLPSTIASFWLRGPAAAFASWQNIVTNLLQSQIEYDRTGSEDALRVTMNTDCGEVYVSKATDELRTPEDLMNRAEDLGECVVPEGVRCLLASVDIQKSHFVCQVHGISSGGDIFVLDRFNIRKSERIDEDGDRHYVKPASYIEDWDLLTTQLLQKTYPLDDDTGRHMMIKAMDYDIHGLKGVTPKAYAYYRKERAEGNGNRLYPLRGTGTPTAPRAVTRYPDSGRSGDKEGAKGEIPVLTINTNLIKDSVDAMLDRSDPGQGMIHFADWLPDSFYSELCAEIRDEKGKWHNDAKLRNESFDLLGYCVALMIKLRIERCNWDNPPSWLKEWDDNPMVFLPEESSPPMAPKKKTDLAKLGSILG